MVYSYRLLQLMPSAPASNKKHLPLAVCKQLQLLQIVYATAYFKSQLGITTSIMQSTTPNITNKLHQAANKNKQTYLVINFSEWHQSIIVPMIVTLSVLSYSAQSFMVYHSWMPCFVGLLSAPAYSNWLWLWHTVCYFIPISNHVAN